MIMNQLMIERDLLMHLTPKNDTIHIVESFKTWSQDTNRDDYAALIITDTATAPRLYGQTRPTPDLGFWGLIVVLAEWLWTHSAVCCGLDTATAHNNNTIQ